MRTIKDVIEDLNLKLQSLNTSIYYMKMNDVLKYPHIIIVEGRRRPKEKDMIDKAYESHIEIDYVSNKFPINFYDIYDIRDNIANLIQNDYEIVSEDIEVGDDRWIIHILITVNVR